MNQLFSKTRSGLLVLALSASAALLTGCKKSDDSPAPAKSRKVKLEITGNFTGALYATYITASGGGTQASIAALPWTKEITYDDSVPATGITVAGSGGSAGQTITLKVTVGDRQVSSTPATATPSGGIIAAAPSYVF